MTVLGNIEVQERLARRYPFQESVALPVEQTQAIYCLLELADLSLYRRPLPRSSHIVDISVDFAQGLLRSETLQVLAQCLPEHRQVAAQTCPRAARFEFGPEQGDQSLARTINAPVCLGTVSVSGPRSDLTPEVIKQVAHVQWFVRADVAAVVQLVSVQVPPLDETLGQHQGWAREFGV